MKSEVFLIIHILFILICIGIDIYLGFIFNFNSSFFYSTLFFIMGIGIGNLIIMIIHLLNDVNYKFYKYMPAMHAGYLVIATIFYYIIEYAKNYDDLFILYWVLLLSLIVIDLVVFLILSIKKKDNKIKITPKIEK